MKKLLPVLGVITWIVLGVISIGSDCGNIVGGAPTGLAIVADTDSTVKLTWSAPAEGTPDKYIVYFKAVGAADYEMIANNVTTTSFVHDPSGKTGTYKVAAKFGSEEYTSPTTVSTVPVPTSVVTLAELNAAGNSGYGWSRTNGNGATYSMTQAANAANVDVYLTDFATGYAGPEYCIASPDIARADDPGAAGVVPEAAWRMNAIAKGLTNENAPLPAHTDISYAQYQEIDQTPFLIAVYTKADEYYALLKIDSQNTGNGTVQVWSWFQLVKGLRLIQH